MSSTDPTKTVVRPSPQGQPRVPDEVLLGRYRVLARRGVGGFGTVCTCWDTRLQRRVAIKRIPLLTNADLRGVSASTVEEALAEARTACLLAHPNIVSVHDFETDGDFAYIVMEYVDGLNLAELLGRVEGGTLTHDECAHLVSSMADALSYAHENGVLHLDIKPTNIIIDRQGTVKLADFGMATLASAAGYGGARGGTVGYMPPEQIQGLLVDERADVFSLAVVTWQALTGQNPFASSSAKGSLDVIARGPKPPISRLDPDLGPEAVAALDQAVLPEASMREPSVDDFADRVLSGLGDPAEGAKSLKALVDQSEEDDVDNTWSIRHLPANIRFPHLAPAIERALSSVLTAVVVWQGLSALAPGNDALLMVSALVSAAVCALWPPIGSVLAGSVFVVALGNVHATAASFPLAALVALAIGAWWVGCGHTDHVATAALLAPGVMSCPLAGVSIAGYGMDPLPAGVTGAVSALFCLVYQLATTDGFAAQTIVYDLGPLLTAPETWIVVLGCGLSALICSAIAMRGSVASGIVGQAVGGLFAIAVLVYCQHMENGWIWPHVTALTYATAVCCGVFLCIETVLRGPLDGARESEVPDELS